VGGSPIKVGETKKFGIGAYNERGRKRHTIFHVGLKEENLPRKTGEEKKKVLGL